MSGVAFQIHLSHDGRAFHAGTEIPGGITAVVGASGSGKTTLMRCLAGLETGARGTIRVGGNEWLGGRRAIPPHRRGIGMCFQESRILPHLSVRANMQYGSLARRFSRQAWTPVIDMHEVSGRLGLDDLLDRRGKCLSGGESRRVALARALLTARTLLMLDEPFTGLDQGSRADARTLIADFHLRSGVPVLIATHGIQGVFCLTDRILMMDGCRCLGCGTATQLLGDPACAAAARRIGLKRALSRVT
jgi:molybdate transport system ATP-binding protein